MGVDELELLKRGEFAQKMVRHYNMPGVVIKFHRVNYGERGLIVTEDLSGCHEVMSQSVKKMP